MAGAPERAPRSLRGLQRALADELRTRGRDDLAVQALDRIAYTDDGSTIYVHIFARPDWPYRRPGQAYVLTFAEKAEVGCLSGHRALVHDAWLRLQDDADDIIRWFDGR